MSAAQPDLGTVEEFEPVPLRRRFPLVRFDDVKMSTTALYLVKGLMPREGLIVVWGPPKCGKSFWVFDLTMHITLGLDYRGRRVAQGAAVYLACEGERGLGARIEAYRRVKLPDVAEDVPFFLLATRLDLAVEHALLISDIRAQLGERPCAAVVIDTLNRSLTGSESSDEDMSAYIKAADAIREAFNCAVIIIHHCGIDDKRPRGHTSLIGAADAQIAVKRDDAGTILATVEFMKDGEAGAEIRSTLRVVELDQDEDGEPVTSCVVDSVEGEPTPARHVKVPPSARTALDLLRKAIDESSEHPPASNHIPVNSRAVRVETWRRYCYAGTISETDTPQARQKSFKRAADRLDRAGLIKTWDGWIWPT